MRITATTSARGRCRRLRIRRSAMVYRVYTEKKKELATEALALKNDLVTLVRIAGLEHLRILNRYDV